MRWTPTEFHEVIDRLTHGESLRSIARRLGRSENAVALHLYRAGYTLRDLRSGINTVRSSTQVAVLLDVHRGTVLMWIERGWLEANHTRLRRKPTKCSPYGFYLISDEYLLRFLGDPIYSVLVDPKRIQDENWRKVVEDARAIHCLLSVQEAATQCGVTRDTLWNRLRTDRSRIVRIGYRAFIPAAALDEAGRLARQQQKFIRKG
jgi:hypothetical protein